MTTWNHRVVHNLDENTGEDYYELAEVYYNDDGKPIMYGKPFLHGESVANLTETAERLLRATGQPILEHDEIVKNGREDEAKSGITAHTETPYDQSTGRT